MDSLLLISPIKCAAYPTSNDDAPTRRVVRYRSSQTQEVQRKPRYFVQRGDQRKGTTTRKLKLTSLPDEILVHIFSFLSPDCVAFTLPRVSKFLRDLSNDQMLWKHFWGHHYSNNAEVTLLASSCWKQTFFALRKQVNLNIKTKKRRLEEDRNVKRRKLDRDADFLGIAPQTLLRLQAHYQDVDNTLLLIEYNHDL